MRPGLSGIGSIIFRDEENILHGETASVDFYNTTIAPYKGELEKWFVLNRSLYVYLLIIFTTILVVAYPKSQIVWRFFPTLPSPPIGLKKLLKPTA